MSEYKFQEIESKWQKHWSDNNSIKSDINSVDKNFYNLCMYPYPSGDLHMGHVRNYTIGDVITRYKMMNGFNVLSPMGWDSFGLPAENAAIKTGIHPKTFTEERINNMKDQIIRLGSLYEWDREVAAHSKDYYKWTQFIFVKLFKNKLAYKKDAPVNWCDSCKTVLANEQVIEGNCDRCDSIVDQKNLNQWFLKISDYSDELLDGLNEIGDWPENVKAMQQNWIGKSEGAEFSLNIDGTDLSFDVFTTRPDTIYGATYLVLAPEHKLVKRLTTNENKNDIKRLIMCSGKVYYDLMKIRNKKDFKDIAIVRIEQLYPFPYDDLEEILTKYENVQEFIWCQEEPLNQGAWFSHRHRIQRVLDRLDKGDEVSLVSRPAAAAPAVGLMKLHLQQQEELVKEAMGK